MLRQMMNRLTKGKKRLQKTTSPWKRNHGRFEVLEDRRLLDGAGGSAMQLFATSSALFVENQGQWQDELVRYGFDGPGVDIAFTNQRLSFVLSEEENDSVQSTEFSVSFDNANMVTPIGLDAGAARFNYFLGDQANWRSGVQGYKTVAYEGLYEGIDLHTFGRRDSLKYEFYVAPGADYSQIQVSYDGIEGLWIDDEGQLHVETELGAIVDDAPYIYQVINGEQIEVAGQFRLIDSDTYTFEITGLYDPTLELVVDPDLDWGSYFGGSSGDVGEDIVADNAGNILAVGWTYSSGWISGGWDTSYGGDRDSLAIKFDSEGNHLWSSYVGGSGEDFGYGVAVDETGNVIMTGRTASSGWVSGGWDTSYNGGLSDAFIVKLNTNGTHVWSTYIGGNSGDTGEELAIDEAGNILMAGGTVSSGWVSGGWDTSFGGGSSDGFVIKFESDGDYVWSSYLGGDNIDYARGIATDSEGNIAVLGGTFTSGWVSGGWDTSLSGASDSFVVKLDSSGNHVWSTYLGGSNDEYGFNVTTDNAGNILAIGWTYSSGWISGGWDTSYEGNYTDGFVVKLESDGDHAWSTYIGGGNSEQCRDIVTDAVGNVLVTGDSASSGWVTGGWDISFGGVLDGFVLMLDSHGDHIWSSYLDGSVGTGIVVDRKGSLFVTGSTGVSGWLSGGWDTSYNGSGDGFVVKITDANTNIIEVDTTSDTVDANPGDGIAEDSSGNTSLRAAIQEANALGIPVRINVPAGTYNLTITGSGNNAGDLDVTGDITIVGAGAGKTVINASSLNDRIFDVAGSGYKLNLSRLTLTGGSTTSVGGAASVSLGGTLIASEVAFVDNNASQRGGAIRNQGSTLTVVDSVFTDNTSGVYGGAISSIESGATVTLGRNVFADNMATSGKNNIELSLGTFINQGYHLIDDTTGHGSFFSATAGDNIITTAGNELVVTSLEDVVNSANNATVLSLREAVIAANTGGGTVWLPAWKHDLTLTGSGSSAGDLDILQSVSVAGVGAGLTVIDASALGDRIFDVAGSGYSLNLSRVTLTGGSTTSVGGAASVSLGGTLTVSEVAFVNNHADQRGGAIRNQGSTLTVTKSVFTGNTSNVYGGAISSIESGATVTLGQNVFADNTATFGRNNVEFSLGTFVNQGYHLIDDTSGTTGFFSASSPKFDYIGAVDHVITSLADEIDNANDTYALTLREAVIASNITAPNEEIWLAPWLYRLVIEGTGGAESGDLDTTDTVTIRGVDDGVAESTVDSTLITDVAFEQISGTLTRIDVTDI
jgi:hypothetical protein